MGREHGKESGAELLKVALTVNEESALPWAPLEPPSSPGN